MKFKYENGIKFGDRVMTGDSTKLVFEFLVASISYAGQVASLANRDRQIHAENVPCRLQVVAGVAVSPELAPLAGGWSRAEKKRRAKIKLTQGILRP